MADRSDVIEVITEDESETNEAVQGFRIVSKGKENFSKNDSKNSNKKLKKKKTKKPAELDDVNIDPWIIRRNKLAKKYKKRQKEDDKKVYEDYLKIANKTNTKPQKLVAKAECKEKSDNAYSKMIDSELKQLALLRIRSELQKVMKNSNEDNMTSEIRTKSVNNSSSHNNVRFEKDVINEKQWRVKKSNSWCASSRPSSMSVRSDRSESIKSDISFRRTKSALGSFRYPKHLHTEGQSDWDLIESKIPLCMKKSVQKYSKAPLCQKSFYNPWGSIAYVHKHEIHSIALPHPNKKNRGKLFDDLSLSTNRKANDTFASESFSELEKIESFYNQDFEDSNNEYDDDNEFDNQSSKGSTKRDEQKNDANCSDSGNFLEENEKDNTHVVLECSVSDSDFSDNESKKSLKKESDKEIDRDSSHYSSDSEELNEVLSSKSKTYNDTKKLVRPKTAIPGKKK